MEQFKLTLLIPLYFLVGIMAFFGCERKNSPSENDQKIDASEIQRVKPLAIEALKDFPSSATIDTLSQLSKDGKIGFKQIRKVLESASTIDNNTSKEEYQSLLNDIIWNTHVLNDRTLHIMQMRPGGGGGGGTSCIRPCYDKYFNCMANSGCEVPWYGVCFCCVPCSLELMGCIKDCVLGSGGGGGGAIMY